MLLGGAIAEADGLSLPGEEEEPEEREPEHCHRCNGEGTVPVLRCPRKLLAFTQIPDFMHAYHLWKKDGTLPVGTSRSEQTISWWTAVTVFDRWVEDTMKILREAEQKRAEADARAKARANRAR